MFLAATEARASCSIYSYLGQRLKGSTEGDGSSQNCAEREREGGGVDFRVLSTQHGGAGPGAGLQELAELCGALRRRRFAPGRGGRAADPRQEVLGDRRGRFPRFDLGGSGNRLRLLQLILRGKGVDFSLLKNRGRYDLKGE